MNISSWFPIMFFLFVVTIAYKVKNFKYDIIQTLTNDFLFSLYSYSLTKSLSHSLFFLPFIEPYFYLFLHSLSSPPLLLGF